MLIYLYGPDTYRQKESLQVILDQYQKKHSALSIESFFLDQKEEFEKLKAFGGGIGLFSSTKLGLLYYPEEAPDEFAKFLKLFLEDKQITLVVIASKKLTKPFDFLLKEPVTSKSFEPLKDASLTAFIKKKAEAVGAKVSPEEINNLVDQYGGDTWGIVTELEKMALGAVTQTASVVPDFFPLMQGLKGSSPATKKLSLLHFALTQYEPALVFNMIASLSDPRMKIKMADYDIAVKSGKLEYPEVLLDYVLTS